MELIRSPWPWYTSGAIIAFVMVLLIYFGKSFGFSSNFRTICSIISPSANQVFSEFNWKQERWNLLFLLGAILGGTIGSTWLGSDEHVQISQATIDDLAMLGIGAPQGMQPLEIFGWESLGTIYGWILMVGGGILVGFGSRYAGGCTSGHAISGLSNMQLPSLVAVIGFFIGGLFATYILLPFLLS